MTETIAVADGVSEEIIGCPGTEHAFKIINGRSIRWQCRRGRCLKKAELRFGHRVKVFHLRDLVTRKPLPDEYEEIREPQARWRST